MMSSKESQERMNMDVGMVIPSNKEKAAVMQKGRPGRLQGSPRAALAVRSAQ